MSRPAADGSNPAGNIYVVYLKNGSIIHGIIIEQVPNVSIKIKSGPNVFFYKMEEIEKFTKEEVKKEDDDDEVSSSVMISRVRLACVCTADKSAILMHARASLSSTTLRTSPPAASLCRCWRCMAWREEREEKKR